MTKEELINSVAEKANLSQDDASLAVEALLESLAEAAQRGNLDERSSLGLAARSQNVADLLREEAEHLDKGHEDFLENIARSQQTLQEIAKS